MRIIGCLFLWGMVMGACQAGGLTPTPALILTLTPVATPGAGIQESSPNSITLVSNPLGDKITFRATVALPSIVKIRIHDHFYAPVTILQKKGTGCFDVLWKVQKVPDGIYYYDSEIKDAKSGSTIKLPMQKVIVTQ